MTAPESLEAIRDEMIREFDSRTQFLGSNTAYYESLYRPDAIGLATPLKMRDLLANVGYPRMYINSVTERMELEGFRLGGADQADMELWDWWQANNLDVESNLGHVEGHVHGRAYATIAAPSDSEPGVGGGVPVIRVESPTALFAQIDPATRKVAKAIRVIRAPETNQFVACTLYLPDATYGWRFESGEWVLNLQVHHGLGVVPVVPLANLTRLSDLYGTSDITPELRSVTDAAARIMMNMQATAELMAIPQRLLFGVDPKEIGIDPETGEKMYDAYMARIMAFSDPEGKAQQFMAAELRNFTEALQELAKQAACYTGLPPQYLSAQSDQPASAEAIKASEARLVKNAERKCKIFGGAWEEVMRIAWRIANPGKELPKEYYRMEAVWRDPSTPTYAAKADAASKLYANGQGVIPKERARIDMGYSVTERQEMEEMDQRERAALLAAAALYEPPTPPTDNTTGGNAPPDQAAA